MSTNNLQFERKEIEHLISAFEEKIMMLKTRLADINDELIEAIIVK
jgi:hypothetical protein